MNLSLRLYDAKNITPETYESLELVPISTSVHPSKNSSNTSNIIGQTSQGTISRLCFS